MASTTPNMGLTKPGVSTEPAPDWGTQLNDSADLIDAHDHSAGKGARVTPAGININALLDMNQQRLDDVGAITQFQDRGGSIAIARTIEVISGELHYRDTAGNLVKLTEAGKAAGAGLGGGWLPVAANFDTVNSSPWVVTPAAIFLMVNTAAARTINLPAATTRRVLIVKDVSGLAGTNNITLSRPGAETIDGTAANKVLQTNYGSWIVVCDGTNYQIL